MRKLVMDVLKDLENLNEYGWEIYSWSEKSGIYIVEVKYGFKNLDDAELSGNKELRKMG